MLFDFTSTEPSERYKLMSQVIIPRPIAWIITQGETLNIAPFSFFSGISSNPPTVMVAIGHKKDGLPKDTLHNIRNSKKCVICSVLPESLEKMHFSSAELHADIDESEHFDIATHTLLEGYPPVISEAPTAFFCSFSQEVTLEGSKTVPLFLTIDHMYVNDTIISERNHLSLELLGRSGHAYMHPGEAIRPPTMPK
jgi:flavin reductase (DIM6/NTAB) family NADH-FMN oxidoreductase RutF